MPFCPRIVSIVNGECGWHCAGAAQADVAVLVVNATNGEFETGFDAGGQTREHTMLARSLGIIIIYLLTCHIMQ